MSAFDRIFIKAYGESAPRSPNIRPAPSPTSSGEASIRSESAGSSGPHILGANPRPARPRLAIAGGIETPAPSTAPLSAFAAARVDESARALLEVDHLAWPDRCDALLERARPGWDALATQLIEDANRGKKTVALTSCRRGEGRTLLALSLARHLGALGLHALVVDADFQKPNLARSCGIAIQTGWDDILASQLPLGEALVAATADNVTLLPWRAASTFTPKIASTIQATGIFRQLASQFDALIVDAPPLGDAEAVGDFTGLAEAAHIDSIYLIHDVRSIAESQVSLIASTLRRSGATLLGIIENFIAEAPTHETPQPIAPRRSQRSLATSS